VGGSIDSSARKRSHALIDLKKGVFIGTLQHHFPERINHMPHGREKATKNGNSVILIDRDQKSC
jgi:hypothetical protein